MARPLIKLNLGCNQLFSDNSMKNSIKALILTIEEATHFKIHRLCTDSNYKGHNWHYYKEVALKISTESAKIVSVIWRQLYWANTGKNRPSCRSNKKCQLLYCPTREDNTGCIIIYLYCLIAWYIFQGIRLYFTIYHYLSYIRDIINLLKFYIHYPPSRAGPY